MCQIHNITIYGVGGVGGYFGGKLARTFPPQDSGGPRIHFVARGEHLEAIREQGLILNTDEATGLRCFPSLATDDPATLPVPDLCLVAVKSYDLAPALATLQGRVSPGTAVLPLLNGIDIYDRTKEVLPDAMVLPACAYVGTHIEKPGVVSQKGGSCTIHLGPDPSVPSFDPGPLRALFEQSAIKYQWRENPDVDIWTKYIFIAAYGLVTASARVTLGQVVASTEFSESARRVMEEIAAIAVGKGVPLAEGIVEQSLKKAAGFPPETKTSYQRDVERGGKDEGDLFGETILRLGARYNVQTPATEQLYHQIRG